MIDAYLNIFVIFFLIFIGYWLSYKQWFNDQTADVFSKLVLNLALPFSMFLNMTEKFSKAEFLHLFQGMLIPVLSIGITFIISLFYSKLTHVQIGRKGIFSTMFTCSNTIFIGLPINLAIFGEVSVPYVLLYYIINTTFFWTIGIYMIAKDSSIYEEAHVTFHPVTALKKILSPAILGFVIGLIWMLLEIPRPVFLITFSSYLGDLTTPLSMFVIGMIVYQIGIKNLHLNQDIVGVLLGRYLISPLIVWLLGQMIKIPEMMLHVFIVQSAMPIQNSVPILARNYQADEEFAASSLGYSILGYLFYIPLLLLFINGFN